MIDKYVVLLVCCSFSGIFAQHQRPYQEVPNNQWSNPGSNPQQSQQHGRGNEQQYYNGVQYSYTNPQHIQQHSHEGRFVNQTYSSSDTQYPQQQQPTQLGDFYCTVSGPYYDCLYSRVFLQYGQNLRFTEHQNFRVSFHESRLDYIPKSLLDASPRVELLNMASLQIQTIQLYAFEEARNLRELYLNDNLLYQIPKNSFDGLGSLKKLVLGRNQIQTFDMGALNGMRSLEQLYIDMNQLNQLPIVWYNTELMIFNASHNNVYGGIKSHFTNNRKLKILDLSFNALSSFDMRQLNNMHYLQSVDVSSNQLRELIIPNMIGSLRARNNSIYRIAAQNSCSAHFLDLSFNQFKAMPNLSSCLYLEHLDLSYNQVEQLNPEQLSTLNNLRDLLLSHNNLFQINNPQRIIWSNLQFLSLSHNSLGIWPENFKLSQSVQLVLSFNKWECVALEPLNSLYILDRGTEQCQEDLQNQQGICCKTHENDAQQLLQLAELVRDSDFHENQNREFLREQCKRKEQPTTNNLDVYSLREEIARAESSKIPFLQNIENLEQQIVEADKNLQEVNNLSLSIKNETDSLSRSIDSYVDAYAVPKEGLISRQEMLGRVLALTSDRKRNNDGLLVQREHELQQNKNQIDAKKHELTKAKQTLREQKTELEALKQQEKSTKSNRDKLRATANKNSASIRGSSGIVSG